MKDVALVVATDDDYGIGRDASMPWRNKDDFKWFRTITSFPFEEGKKNAVIMGRTTWVSLPKMLPNRLNVVLTRGDTSTITCAEEESENLKVFSGLEDAVKAMCSDPEVGKVFIIGGASVYEQCLSLPEVTEAYVTNIEGMHLCDTFFPMKRMLASGFSKFSDFNFASIDLSLYTKQDMISLANKSQNDLGILGDG